MIKKYLSSCSLVIASGNLKDKQTIKNLRTSCSDNNLLLLQNVIQNLLEDPSVMLLISKKYDFSDEY